MLVSVTAGIPWEGKREAQIFRLLDKGERPKFSKEGLSSTLVQITECSWEQDPKRRPSFKDLHDRVRAADEVEAAKKAAEEAEAKRKPAEEAAVAKEAAEQSLAAKKAAQVAEAKSKTAEEAVAEKAIEEAEAIKQVAKPEAERKTIEKARAANKARSSPAVL